MKESLAALRQRALEQRMSLLATEEALEEAQRRIRPDVIRRLTEYRQAIDVLVSEAKALAESADLVFYYASGYEEWSWSKKEDWSSSNC